MRERSSFYDRFMMLSHISPTLHHREIKKKKKEHLKVGLYDYLSKKKVGLYD